MQRSNVPDHYARRDLIAAIRDGIAAMGKTIDTVSPDDLAAVDQFHIGGCRATEDLFRQLDLSAADHLLDIGSGLGGPARFAADRYECRVTGIDLTPDYVEAGNAICRWLGLSGRVSLHQGDALSMPFPDRAFSAACMLHVGMNIADKVRLFSGIARVLQADGRLAVYDVMRTQAGELAYPLPWATTSDANAIATPGQYRNALLAAGFEIVSQRDRKDFALAYFRDLKAKMAADGAAGPLGLHTLMGDRREFQVRNMIENITNGYIAPIEIIARRL